LPWRLLKFCSLCCHYEICECELFSGLNLPCVVSWDILIFCFNLFFSCFCNFLVSFWGGDLKLEFKLEEQILCGLFSSNILTLHTFGMCLKQVGWWSWTNCTSKISSNPIQSYHSKVSRLFISRMSL
jgi:hypothetical protein